MIRNFTDAFEATIAAFGAIISAVFMFVVGFLIIRALGDVSPETSSFVGFFFFIFIAAFVVIIIGIIVRLYREFAH